jgi:hypothetical protein
MLPTFTGWPERWSGGGWPGNRPDGWPSLQALRVDVVQSLPSQGALPGRTPRVAPGRGAYARVRATRCALRY